MKRTLPVAMILIGIVLLIYMVIVESEPGALPLGLIVFGGVWLFFARRKPA